MTEQQLDAALAAGQTDTHVAAPPAAAVAKSLLDPTRTTAVAMRWMEHARRQHRAIRQQREIPYPMGVVTAEMEHLLAEVENQQCGDDGSKAAAAWLAKLRAYYRGAVRKNRFVFLPAEEVAGHFGHLLELLEVATGGPLCTDVDDADDDDEPRPERKPSSAPIVTMTAGDDDDTV